MLLQILRTLESLSTEVTFVRLEWDVDSDVRSDMVTLYGSSAALIPTTGEVKVICAFATDQLIVRQVPLGEAPGDRGFFSLLKFE